MNSDDDVRQKTGSTHGMTDLSELPPSCKLVHKVLEYEGELTQPELAAETGLPKRTVRYALDRLDEADVLEERPSLEDARQKHYSLDTAVAEK